MGLYPEAPVLTRRGFFVGNPAELGSASCRRGADADTLGLRTRLNPARPPLASARGLFVPGDFHILDTFGGALWVRALIQSFTQGAIEQGHGSPDPHRPGLFLCREQQANKPAPAMCHPCDMDWKGQHGKPGNPRD